MGLVMRIAVITAGLAVAGAVAGGVVGVAMMFCWMLVQGGLTQTLGDLQMLAYGGLFGGFVGGVLGPAAAWLLMRSVPLWKAVSVTALGTLAAAIAGLVIGGPELSFNLSFAGFAAAAIALRVTTKRSLPAHQPPRALQPE